MLCWWWKQILKRWKEIEFLENEAVKCNMVQCTTVIEKGKVIEGNTHMYLQRIIFGCFCRAYIEFQIVHSNQHL